MEELIGISLSTYAALMYYDLYLYITQRLHDWDFTKHHDVLLLDLVHISNTYVRVCAETGLDDTTKD